MQFTNALHMTSYACCLTIQVAKPLPDDVELTNKLLMLSLQQYAARIIIRTFKYFLVLVRKHRWSGLPSAASPLLSYYTRPPLSPPPPPYSYAMGAGSTTDHTTSTSTPLPTQQSHLQSAFSPINSPPVGGKLHPPHPSS